MGRGWKAVSLLCVAPLVFGGCEEPFPTFAEEDTLRELLHLGPPGDDPTNAYLRDPRAISLGQRLFADPSLSSCGTVSCQSCHLPENGYTYAAGPGAPGCGPAPTARNPPTLLNVAHNTWFMWDQRADRLWSQALLPFLDPNEMGGSPAALRTALSQPAYAADYAALFGDEAGGHSEDRVMANFGKALAAYEWTLVRTTSPFDRQVAEYLEAVESGAQAQHPLHLALKTFVRTGSCTVCHKGPTLSDESFHNVGLQDDGAGRGGRLTGIPTLLASSFHAASEYSDKSSGTDAFAANRVHRLRSFFNSTAQRDTAEALGQLEGAFKTPTLRNVALTAPYMHTGALATLEDVVEFYNRGGDPEGTFAGTRAGTDSIRRLDLSREEKAALVELLTLMTGDEGPPAEAP